MTEYKKVFIDTAPFIYFFENNELFADKVEQFIGLCLLHETPMVTSVISYMEFSVMPERSKKIKLISSFNEVLLKLSIPFMEVNLSVAQRASKLRAKYIFLKGLDALQIAIAVENKCDAFLTNDKQLKKIKEVKIIVLDDLK